jgi:hypothetical protein
MAKRKYEFRPDNLRSTLASKLYLTPNQRLTILRWFLLCALVMVVSVLQDVILCRFRLFGATTDLVPCTIILICVFLGTNSSCLFVLLASLAYQFSGTSPGYYVVPLITVLAVMLSMFRESFLRKSFSSVMLCAGVALLAYEMLLFVTGLAFGSTRFDRWNVFLLTGGLTAIALPILYPIVKNIAKIGGEIWKE